MGRNRRAKEQRALARREAQQQQRLQAQFVASQVSYWSGPTPSPEVLREYEQIVHGAADRIIALAERQSDHRQKLESKALDNGHTRALLGSVFGFTIGMTAILGGIYLALNGQELGGYSIMLGTVTTLAAVFVYGRRSARTELAEKSPAASGSAKSTTTVGTLTKGGASG
jgi:uncharacterized membrane protein